MAVTSKGARRVQEFLSSRGFELELVELPDSTRTASDAACAIGCAVEQIVKSLVFVGTETGTPVLVLASGPNMVDVAAVERGVGEAVGKADAKFVKQHTGFPVGGVPPVGHKAELRAVMDEDLLRHEEIWAAAGSPNAVFKLSPKILVELAAPLVLPVK